MPSFDWLDSGPAPTATLNSWSNVQILGQARLCHTDGKGVNGQFSARLKKLDRNCPTILAIGAAAPQPVVIDRQVVVRDRMKVTMSCDHRVVDGAAGAEYLRTLRQYVEQPVRLLL